MDADASCVLTEPPSATIRPVTIDQHRFLIPHTSLILNIVIFEELPLERAALGRSILNAQMKVRSHLEAHRDSYIWPQDNRECF